MQLPLGPLCITLWKLELRKLANLLVFIVRSFTVVSKCYLFRVLLNCTPVDQILASVGSLAYSVSFCIRKSPLLCVRFMMVDVLLVWYDDGFC